MTILAALGTVEYNGYAFDGTAHLTMNVDAVQDEAQRTIVYHRHVLHVSAIIQNDSGTDSDMLSLRRLLGEQGRFLRFINRGFGNDLIVNAAGGGGLRDVKFGPKPKVVKWEPIAHIRAHEVEWEVEVCVPICDNGTTRTSGIMALNYDVSFDIDERGFTTRTITGYIEIAMTRFGRAIPDIADANTYLDAYNTTPLSGFHRTQSRHLSLDKSRLDFSVTDREIDSPNAYPAGVVAINCRHRAGWRLDSGLPRNRITCEIEMAADRPQEHALLIFAAIYNQRLAVAKAATAAATSTSGGTTSATGAVIIDEFEIEEEIFSNRSSFSLAYRIPASLKEFIFKAGIWVDLPTNWPAWDLSMVKVHSQRGWAELGVLATDDSIVDLCQVGQQGYQPRQNQIVKQAKSPLAPLKNERPDPKNSWIAYGHSTTVIRDDLTTRQRILQPTIADTTQYQPNDFAGLVYPAKTGKDDIIQEGGQNSYYVMVTGHATRAGWEIPRPRYEKFGTSDAPATEVDGVFSMRLAGNAFGLPIYQAVWRLMYAIPFSPNRVDPLPNPLEFLNGDGTAQQ